MIDSGATIALNAADTKSVAKSGLKNGKGNDGEGKNGFSDALSSLKAGPQQKKPGAGDDKTAVDVQATPVTDDDALQLALPDEDAVLPETPLPTPTAKPPAKPSAHLQPLVATETPVETAEPTVAEPAADKKLDASKAAKLAEAGKDVLQLAKAIVDADLTPATLPQGIKVASYPQLRRIAWQLSPGAELTSEEAWGTYERNWRHVDVAALDANERRLLADLALELGRKPLHV